MGNPVLSENVSQYMNELGQNAREASVMIARADTGQKNQALLAIADRLDSARSRVLEANQKDLDAGRKKGLDAALLDRLELTDTRIDSMIEGLKQVSALPDPRWGY